MPTESMWQALDKAMMSMVANGARGRSNIAEEVSRIIGVRLSFPALMLLDTLNDCPMRLTELGTQVGTSLPSVTRQIQGMEREGLVLRQADASDGRVALISLSTKGILAQRASMEVRAASLKEVLRDWPEDDLQLLAPLLEKLTATMARGRSDTR
jgi:DNA-binding MarR family transcriptional regulator